MKRPFLLSCILILFTFYEAFSSSASIDYVDIGNGNCVIAHCGDDKKVIVDCGTINGDGDGSKSRKIKGLISGGGDVSIVVSHPDKDHINLLSKAFDTEASCRRIKNLVFGGSAEDYFVGESDWRFFKYFFDNMKNDDQKIIFLSHDISKVDMSDIEKKILPLWLELSNKRQENYYKKKRNNLRKIEKIVREKLAFKQREHLFDKKLEDLVGVRGICPGTTFKVLSANAGHGYVTKKEPIPFVINRDSNTNSIVLKITAEGTTKSTILTGDATGVTTDAILHLYENSMPELETDVMLACHHGADSEGSNNIEWAKKTKPKLLICSSGESDWHHPRCSATANYYEALFEGSFSFADEHFFTCGMSPKQDQWFRDIRDFEPVMPMNTNEDKVTSVRFKTKVPFYNTNDSGTITATFEADKIKLKTEESGSFEIPGPLTTTTAVGGVGTLTSSSAVPSTPVRTPGSLVSRNPTSPPVGSALSAIRGRPTSTLRTSSSRDQRGSSIPPASSRPSTAGFPSGVVRGSPVRALLKAQTGKSLSDTSVSESV